MHEFHFWTKRSVGFASLKAISKKKIVFNLATAKKNNTNTKQPVSGASIRRWASVPYPECRCESEQPGMPSTRFYKEQSFY